MFKVESSRDLVSNVETLKENSVNPSILKDSIPRNKSNSTTREVIQENKDFMAWRARLGRNSSKDTEWKERYKSNLTKRYYFPIVEGSKNGFVLMGRKKVNAFVSYIFSNNEVTKVAQYNQDNHWLLDTPITRKRGFHMQWSKQSRQAFNTVDKLNKYLNRQYCRISNHLRKGEVNRAIAIWRLMHTKSKIWTVVLIAKKLPFMSITETRMVKLIKTIRKLMRTENSEVKYKRIFLEELNPDGSIKKHRPLGVPSLEWRVIAASYEFLLVNLWKKGWSKNQYACMPKRGTVDAWMEILTKLSKRNVTEIIGYDLAKFFDLVYVFNIIKMGLPPFLTEYFFKMVQSKAQIRDEDLPLEEERLKKTVEERLSNIEKPLNPKLYQFNSRVKEGEGSGGYEAPYVSFPQGLNTSPVMCCRALELTGIIDHPNITQYVDDGVIINTTERTLTLKEFKEGLNSSETGICISGSKTETIMKDGEFLKPLKFLGCSYDGKTFKSHTRKGGIWEAEKAPERIERILTRLRYSQYYRNPTKAWIIKKARRELIGLINEGWNHLSAQTLTSIVIKEEKNKTSLKLNDRVAWWTKGMTKITKLKRDSIEALTYQMLNRRGNRKIMDSTNAHTMLGSYYIVKELKDTKTKVNPPINSLKSKEDQVVDGNLLIKELEKNAPTITRKEEDKLDAEYLKSYIDWVCEEKDEIQVPTRDTVDNENFNDLEKWMDQNPLIEAGKRKAHVWGTIEPESNDKEEIINENLENEQGEAAAERPSETIVTILR